MEENENDVSLAQGLCLTCPTSSTSIPFDPNKCIICQKPESQREPMSGGIVGRKKVREVAERRNDNVHMRLKHLTSDFEFKYHNTYACYKKYTDVRNLHNLAKDYLIEGESESEPGTLIKTESRKPSTRSSITPREAPSNNVDSKYRDCAICGCDRVSIKQRRIREKNRICEPDRANKFLSAIHHKKDDVYIRCADLETPEDVYAADLYCHDVCFKRYIYIPKESDKIKEESLKDKLFNDVITTLDPLIKQGYGFTLTDIREMMMEHNATIEVYNRDVKKFLQNFYGDRIRFCPSNKVYEPEMFFSSDVTIDDVMKSLRNKDTVKSAGEILRESLKKVDFKLTDHFCDGYELKDSWENTQMPDELITFFSALFNIKRSQLLKNEMLEIIDPTDETECTDDTDQYSNMDDSNQNKKHIRLNCLFQIIYYQLFHGTKKTPLTTSYGQYHYGKSRSREILTLSNHMGISESYKEVRKSRQKLAAYAIAKSEENQVPIPSSFTCDSFTFGALDNADFVDKSSISGTKSDHITMQVIYQHVVSPQASKPLISEMNMNNLNQSLPEKLPCQQVPLHFKPTKKPSLPDNFKVIEETGIVSKINFNKVIQEADEIEFLISFIRNGFPNETDSNDIMPTWGASHSLISSASPPLTRIGFLPAIPSPVTNYATVRKSLENFQSVRKQLNPSQTLIPVFCDEGVYHTLADIVMEEPDCFSDIHGMLGMFHWVKTLLKCAGRYLRGSGIEDAVIECEVFGKQTLNSVLEGSHYARSMKGILLISDMLSSLAWKSFWQWIQQRDETINNELMISAKKVWSAFNKWERCEEEFADMKEKSGELQKLFDEFIKECCEKSELCKYFYEFQHMANVIKHIVAADREGNFPKSVCGMKSSLPIFAERDCVHYLRYGSFCYESTRTLEATHPEIFQSLMEGLFVVKDKSSGFFNAVAPDLKLEQTIQKASKGSGGIVGQVKNLSFTTEWQLTFHEVMLISNNFREKLNENSMKCSETSYPHHEFKGNNATMIHRHLASLLDFIRDKGNPYIIQAPGIRLHNIITKQLTVEEVKVRLLQIQKNGNKVVQEFRKERLIDKTQKLSATISKRNLPYMDFKPTSDMTSNQNIIAPKVLAAAQRDIDVSKERGINLDKLYCHDILPTSLIFDGNLPLKPDKSMLMVDLEKHLSKNELEFPGGNISVIVDFMSKLRSFSDLSSFQTFGQAIQCVLNAGHNICNRTNVHIVFDSYLENSIKSSERVRRAGGRDSIEINEINSNIAIPKQMDKFWISPINKVNLQKLLIKTAYIPGCLNIPIILSGYVTDEEIIPAQYLPVSRPTPVEYIESLTSKVEEADDRLVVHCAYEISCGSTRLLVISNDTDTVTRLLYFFSEFQKRGLKELWVEFGKGERKRYLPLHILAERLGQELCRVVVKAHILTGDDSISKIGTKHASLLCDPQNLLVSFGESSEITEDEIEKAEKYLVDVWAGVRAKTKCKTFNQLRLQNITSSTPKPLNSHPPTSSVIRGHLKRSYYVIKNVVNLLNNPNISLDPLNYCWILDNDMLVPEKCLNPLPEELTVICKCTGKCSTNICSCKRNSQECVIYCHKQNNVQCTN